MTWQEDVIRNLLTQITVHDDPAPGAWFCGECPYTNVGAMCTKCGAPRWQERVLIPAQDEEQRP